jgi:Ca2+-transporting ATPase
MAYRVRGLLGQASFARWLESWFARDVDLEVHASSATGVLRIDRKARCVNAVEFTRCIDRALEEFDAHVAASGQRCLPLNGARPRTSTHSVPRAGRPRRRAAGPPAGARHPTPQRTGPCPDAHALSVEQVLRRLDSTSRGLTEKEAAARLLRDGPNRIADITGRGDLRILLDQFTSVPVALLGGSGLASLAMRAYGDATAIAAVLAANGAIGFVTERRAERTVAGLRRLAPGIATVVRGGRERAVPSHEIVVGDVLVLKPGQPIAADARVMEAHRLSVNEAPLTGESLPVRKSPLAGLAARTPLGERTNMVHLGTVVSGGLGSAVVTAVAEATALGAIRTLAQEAEAPRTRLQVELDGLGKRLAIGATVMCTGVVAAGLLRGRAAGPLLRSAVALGVAAIPEGLPTVATSLLASGIRSMQKRNVFARSLDAIENLGAVDIVCLDKTGTLTENRMHVASVVLGRARELVTDRRTGRRGLRPPRDALLVCALCNELQRNGGGWQGSATELALMQLADEHGLDVDAARRSWPQIAMKQRSEHHPYMVTLHREPGGAALVAVKGRPHEVLSRCTSWFDGRGHHPLTPKARRGLLQLNDELASLGHRVLALACRRQRRRTLGETGGLTWLGMVGLADRVRPDVSGTIERFRAAGIQPKMLTGDQPGTARAVARQIGLDHGAAIVDAGNLPESADALAAQAEQAVGFARTTPGMKLELVRALQQRGHVVAMTGDGINDGPAMKTADVGVAMGATGTDFAHAMSDLVLQGNHPADLLQAIAEGRTAYLNVKKAVKYLVATNLSELALTGLCAVVGLPDPLDPLALLWTNLITDVSPAIALGLEPAEPNILERPPFRRTGGLLDRDDWRRVMADGGIMTSTAFAAFLYALTRYGPGPRARTIAFVTLTGSQLAYALTARSESRITDRRLRSNRLLYGVTAASLALQAGTVILPPLRGVLRTTPLGPADWLVVVGAATLPALIRELSKVPPTAALRLGHDRSSS